MASERNSHAGGHLTTYIIISIGTAILLAIVWPSMAARLMVGGEVFLRLLQMVVVPLVMASVMSGILGLGDVRKLGRPGGYAVLYYLLTTVIAVGTGLMVVNVINPGVGIKKELVEDARQEGSEAVENANNALDPRTKKVTWTRRFDDDELILNSTSSSGVSTLLSVPSGHST
ncbi:MAG: cation:dicarboxylase symporter family transporter, partial [Pirellulaceae bacterium]